MASLGLSVMTDESLGSCSGGKSWFLSVMTVNFILLYVDEYIHKTYIKYMYNGYVAIFIN